MSASRTRRDWTRGKIELETGCLRGRHGSRRAFAALVYPIFFSTPFYFVGEKKKAPAKKWNWVLFFFA